jgi:undecaprenyl pyrophosphate synthase
MSNAAMAHQAITIPTVGIIPDGNRRWSLANGVSQVEAYQFMMRTIVAVMNDFCRLGNTTTFVVFLLSKDNLRRGAADIDAVLVGEAEGAATQLAEFCHDRQFRAIPIGIENCSAVPSSPRTLELVQNYQSVLTTLATGTASHTAGALYLLAGYDALEEIATLLSLPPSAAVDIRNMSVPVTIDLVLRTSLEQRLSGFPPLQSRYAELFFLPKLFPEMTTADVEEVVAAYGHRSRRFGR